MSNERTTYSAPLGNVLPFRRRSGKITGLEGLVTIETISALIALTGHIGHVWIDFTVGRPCGCAFCALRGENPVGFRKDGDVSRMEFETIGNVGFSEHLR